MYVCIPLSFHTCTSLSFNTCSCNSAYSVVEVYSCNVYRFNFVMILAAVNCEPKEVYLRFENRLLNELPADDPNFIKLLKKNNIIGEKAKSKMGFPDQTRRGLAASIVQEIDISPSFSDDKFRKLLSVMTKYKHGLEILAQEIEIHLNPGMYLSISSNVHTYTYIHTYIHTYIRTYIHTCIHMYVHMYNTYRIVGY